MNREGQMAIRRSERLDWSDIHRRLKVVQGLPVEAIAVRCGVSKKTVFAAFSRVERLGGAAVPRGSGGGLGDASACIL
ncbi:hypothetical protein TSO5_16125 [Azospirillum sp. TSO5]|nr:hypothetical protein TSO5_16125 [Azospirillum sp. TSO5]